MVLLSKVKADDPVNLLIRTQFGEWPKDRLAQIHSGETGGTGEFCGSYYRLKSSDRGFGTFFKQLRDPVANAVATVATDAKAQVVTAIPSPLQRLIGVGRKHLGETLIQSGFWEVVFRLRISETMAGFIDRFRPDVIYCQGYSLGFAELPLIISRRFGVPICFQTTDDWPHRAYRLSPVRYLIRRATRRLVRRSAVRLAFGEKMRIAYEQRYGVPFQATYHLDDPRRFKVDPDVSGSGYRIVYTGSLGHRRFDAILDILHAARALRERLGEFEIAVYSDGLPKDMPTELLRAPELSFHPLPAHEDLPRILASATVLLLPESFDEVRQAIEYSISTKAHLYMMSGRPIIAYGPRYSGVIAYAAEHGWGLVVDRREPERLREALEQALSDPSCRERLRRNADACIEKHHDLTAGRERFRLLLAAAASSKVRDVV